MVKRKAKRKTKRKAVKRKTIKRRSKPKAVKRSLASRIYGAVKSYRTRKREKKEHGLKAHRKVLKIGKRMEKRDKSTLAGGYFKKDKRVSKRAGFSLVNKDRKPLKSIRGTITFKRKRTKSSKTSFNKL